MGSWNRNVRRWFLPAIGVLLIAFTPPATQTLLEEVGLWTWFAWVVLGIAVAVGTYWTVEFIRARQKAEAWPGWSEVRIGDGTYRVCVGSDAFPELRSSGAQPMMRGSIRVDANGLVAASLVDDEIRVLWLSGGERWGPFPLPQAGALLAIQAHDSLTSVSIIVGSDSATIETHVSREGPLLDSQNLIDDPSSGAVAAGFVGNGVFWVDDRGHLRQRASDSTIRQPMRRNLKRLHEAMHDRLTSVHDLDVARHGGEYLVVAAGSPQRAAAGSRGGTLRRARGVAPVVAVMVDAHTYRPTRLAEFDVTVEDNVRLRVDAVRQGTASSESQPEVISSMGGAERRHPLTPGEIDATNPRSES